MVKRVTIQDIADACGVSRNTVSKIFNNRGTVKEATKQEVLKKAQEMGYIQFFADNFEQPATQTESIALLTCNMPTDSHYGTSFIPALASQISRGGYTLRMYEFSEDEMTLQNLSSKLNLDQTAAIVTIEIFSRENINNICMLGLPVIVVDGFSGTYTSIMNCDRVSMENVASMAALVNHITEQGAKRLGFIGDPKHCHSFEQRWLSFCHALTKANLSFEKDLCILDPDQSPYKDPAWISSKIAKMPVLPDALICANDYIALHVMTALKQMGYSIPKDVMVAGFDGTAQSAVVAPSLTTIQIPAAEIGRIAADVLLNRISNPNRPFISVDVKTTPIYRDSTDMSQHNA